MVREKCNIRGYEVHKNQFDKFTQETKPLKMFRLEFVYNPLENKNFVFLLRS